MGHAQAAAATLFRLLAGTRPAVGQQIAHPGRAVDPSALAQFGAQKATESFIDWTAVGFMGLWASIVLIVFVLWYRQLRFREDLEGGRPRMPEDDR